MVLSNHLAFLVINILLIAIALGLFVPVAVLFIECTAALLPSRSKIGNVQTPRPRTAVLVPAHNEESGISATLQTLVPQLTERDRLIVIADNCTDRTAEIARTFGATAIERQDLERRGKGYALDYGLQFIEADPPDVVVVVDADCIVHQETIEQITRVTAALGQPVQATYLMAQPANPSPKDSVSALAFMVKNLVRLRGLARLGLPCLLTGTGMAFPWSVIREAPLASGNIVEDMQLGLDLAIAGYTTVFCSEAKVTGLLPQQQQVAKGQRTRWEHGHLQTLLTQVPQLLKASLSQKRFDLFALALDMCVPPLSLLVMLWLAATGLALLAGALGATWIPGVLLGIEGLLLLLSIVTAWAKFGRADLPVQALLAVPFYILWKIPLYLAFLVRPQTKWIRTQRDAVDASES
ncbi:MULTISPECIES: glycosyltransferase family 2 protein [unclassified Coleofasciculus]|uniref:glycosyltransferase family 2 protein n=1 Tax=unclassified Coleofasciculus TaxID=2692782 RepID=UPI00187F2587|nr:MULTISPECIES: glycosyltransferase family 2 protein [unclassified Coleofasciculus]MBE9125764.1 glycosyltransferase family 2 protein [Coleofasciculus sp. LEGE 07081]MBE9148437.1 glycosyltransferase family 2 protein [Coleofasciculus sp. LEGE 07092]